MGARPSSFYKGGGRLNNVPGTIVAIGFTDLELIYTKGQSGFTLAEFTPGKIKGADGKLVDKRQRLTAIVRILLDGAKAEIEEPFEAGLAENFAITEDGYTIWDAAFETPEEAAEAEGSGGKVRGISLTSEFGRFVDELCKAGLPESLLPERGINYEGAFGTRVQFVQRPRKDKNGNVIRKKGSDGKERDKTYTSVDEVLSLPDSKPAVAAPAKAAKPAAGKVATPAAAGKATPGKVAGKAKTPPEPVFDLEATATEYVLSSAREKGVLGEDGYYTIPIAKLGGVGVLSKFPKHPNRNDIAKKVVETAFLAKLAEEGHILFGADEKAARVVKVPALDEELAETVDE